MPKPAKMLEQRIDHFFSMPAERADRWRDVVAAARAWSVGRADQNAAEAAFAELGPIEGFHAFPGSALMARLSDRLRGGDAVGFTDLVRRVSAAIVTRDFKYDPAEWRTTEEVVDTPADVLPPTLRHGDAKRPYFEMLIVAPGCHNASCRSNRAVAQPATS
jgi:arginine decarboxylase